MKKYFTLFAVLACCHAMYAQTLPWNVNDDNKQLNVTYTGAFTIVFDNLGSRTIGIDLGSSTPQLCLTENKLKVELKDEKLVLGICDTPRKIDKTTSFQLKSSEGTKCTVNIRFSPPPSNPVVPAAQPVAEAIRPFYDALVLKQGSADDVKKISEKYNIDINTSNPFLQTLPTSSRISGSGSSIVQSLGTSIGGLDVTKFADGFAKFLVKRAKEELTIAFFEDFKKELDKHEDIKDLFPNTKATLDLVNEEIYNYERYLVTLRENFETDFEALPDNITKIVDNHKTYFESHKELASGIFVGSKIAIGLRDKDHPGEIISSLAKEDLDGFKPKVVQSFLVVQTFSEALRDSATQENANYWISKKQFQQMAKDPLWIRYFIGLSLEMMKGKDDALYSALITKTSSEPFKYTLDSMITQTSRINTLIATHRDEPKVTLETITGYVDAATDLLATADNAIQLLKPSLDERKFLKDKFIPFVRNSNNLVGNISKKKYSSALVNIIELYSLVTPKDDTELNNFITTTKPILDEVKAGDKKKWKDLEIFVFYQDVMQLSSEALNTKYTITNDALKTKIQGLKTVMFPTHKAVSIWLVKYGGFIAAMLSAEDADEVAGVIETYALPSGSARIKRQSYFNISVNSYLGLYGGWDKAHKWAPGVSAPVGVALSWGTKKGGSFSIFPTLIDIGAITAFRFKDDTAQVAKIYLREIFSPGLFLSFGIRKLPISINVGGQFAPLLERVVAGSNDYNIKRNFRTSLSFVVDIPLLNLYNRVNRKP